MTVLPRLPAAVVFLCAVMTACSTPTLPGAAIDVFDEDTKQDFTYYSDNFQVARVALPGAPQSAAEAKMLEAVNAERAKGGVCPTDMGGKVSFPPRAPIIFEGHLHAAAAGHAVYIVNYQTSKTLSHIGEGGLTPTQRMVKAGYKPVPIRGKEKAVFEESLSIGIDDPANVIAAWKTSVRHCAALFDVVTDGSTARGQKGDTVAWVLDVGGIISK